MEGGGDKGEDFVYIPSEDIESFLARKAAMAMAMAGEEVRVVVRVREGSE